jgi:unspecific monooxygenase
MPELAFPLPIKVIADMLGVPEADHDRIKHWSEALLPSLTPALSADAARAVNVAAAEFRQYFRALSELRRAEPRDDLLTHMIHTEHKGQYLTEEELISTTIVLLNAGHEATVHQIGNSVRTILESGSDPADIFRDEATTERTVEETLRICAPVHIFQRWALEPAEIDGVSFQRGDKVSLILAAANLDPTKFTDPLAFRPDRNEAANLSFGAGIHFCIGAPLARLELNVVLPILFARLAGLKLAKTPDVKDVYHFHGLDRLDLNW